MTDWSKYKFEPAPIPQANMIDPYGEGSAGGVVITAQTGPAYCDVFDFFPRDINTVVDLAQFLGDQLGDESVILTLTAGENGDGAGLDYAAIDELSRTITSFGTLADGAYCVTAPWDGPWPIHPTFDGEWS